MSGLPDVLRFDDATHTYTVGGIVRPSVTQVLSRMHDFAGVPLDVLEAAQERGTAVHLATQYHDEHDLDESSLDALVAGYLCGWKRFTADHAPSWTSIEAKGYSQRYGFAGTVDRRGALRHAARAIVDIKTSLQSHRVWGMQTAAYRQIAAEEDPAWALARRFTVQLRADGTYSLLAWDDPDDWPAFLALITLTNWSNKA